jgi:hypothetical protein
LSRRKRDETKRRAILLSWDTVSTMLERPRKQDTPVARFGTV